MAEKKALVDSGATDNFIHPAFAKRLGLTMTPLEKPKRIYNIDNTSNKSGSITHSLELKVTTKGADRIMRFLVTDIGNEDILLGYPWLATFEPKFGWKDAMLRYCRNVRPTWVRFDSKDTKESEWCSRF